MTAVTKPRAACLIGWPAAHSRSPLIHHYWLRKLGIAGGYVIEAVPPEELQDFVLRLSFRGFVGANVTLPHKERAGIVDAGYAGARRRRGQHAVVRRRRAALDQHRHRGLYQ
jgi:shikimate dehydrogenase